MGWVLRRFFVASICAAWGLTVGFAQSQDEVDWLALAQSDLQAARHMIMSCHPAADLEIGDTVFLSNEAENYERLSAMVLDVETEAGYRAILSAYGVSFNDSHIAARFYGDGPDWRWPGIMATRRDGRFYVIGSAHDAVRNGDEIVSCEGQDIQDYAATRLGEFRYSWRLEANRIKAATYLFLEDGNPFAPAPQSCEFERRGLRFSETLTYHQTEGDEAFEQARSWYSTARSFSIRPFDETAYWISLPELAGDGYGLVNKAEAMASELQDASYIVVDVRGNGGGNSEIADRLAVALGLPNTDQSIGIEIEEDRAHWRICEQNIETFRSYLNDENLSDEVKLYVRDMVDASQSALESGQSFLPPLSDVPERQPSIQARAQPHTARIIVLTDQHCFSSCLMLMDRFIAGGASQVGIITDGDSWYMEVGRSPLPSGRSSFSTMMKVSFDATRTFGPYEPVHTYRGDISDTQAVEEWIMAFRAR